MAVGLRARWTARERPRAASACVAASLDRSYPPPVTRLSQSLLECQLTKNCPMNHTPHKSQVIKLNGHRDSDMANGASIKQALSGETFCFHLILHYFGFRLNKNLLATKTYLHLCQSSQAGCKKWGYKNAPAPAPAYKGRKEHR